VLSSEPDATSLPSGEKATELTGPEWPSSGPPYGAPVAASQSRTVLSIEPDATSLPSGEKATDLTQSEWPSSGLPCGAPVAASQSRTVLLSEPDATSLPSGEKATDLTQFEWPSTVCTASLQFACPFEILYIPLIHSSNYFRTILCSEVKTRAELYIWRGVFLIIERLHRINLFASRINVYRLGLLSALIIY
jgi:hypothetical protein